MTRHCIGQTADLSEGKGTRSNERPEQRGQAKINATCSVHAERSLRKSHGICGIRRAAARQTPPLRRQRLLPWRQLLLLPMPRASSMWDDRTHARLLVLLLRRPLHVWLTSYRAMRLLRRRLETAMHRWRWRTLLLGLLLLGSLRSGLLRKVWRRRAHVVGHAAGRMLLSRLLERRRPQLLAELLGRGLLELRRLLVLLLRLLLALLHLLLLEWRRCLLLLLPGMLRLLLRRPLLMLRALRSMLLLLRLRLLHVWWRRCLRLPLLLRLLRAAVAGIGKPGRRCRRLAAAIGPWQRRRPARARRVRCVDHPRRRLLVAPQHCILPRWRVRHLRAVMLVRAACMSMKARTSFA